MNIAISHSDSDGVLSVVLLLKAIGNKHVERVYFTSPYKVLKTICNAVEYNRHENSLYIFDIAAKRETMYASAIFSTALWIDHHEWEISLLKEKPNNVKFYVDSNSKSAANVVGKFFNIKTPLVDYANEIDSNNIKSEQSQRIYHIVESYRRELKFSNILNFARRLAEDDNEIFNKIYDSVIEEHKEWIKNSIKIALSNLKKEKISVKDKEINVCIIEQDFSLPVSQIYNKIVDEKIDCDLFIAVFHESQNTKIELRSNNWDVYKIAKGLGGGGHKLASGATLNGNFTKDYIVKNVKNLMNDYYIKEI